MRGKPADRRADRIVDRRWLVVYEVKLGLVFLVNLLLYSFILYLLLNEPMRATYAGSRDLLLHMREILWIVSLVTFLVQSIVASVFLILLGLYTSHTIAGPMYRMGVVLKSLLSGKIVSEVRFRKGDRIQPVAEAANRMIREMTRRVRDVRTACERLEAIETSIENGSDCSDASKRLKSVIRLLDMGSDSEERGRSVDET